MKYALPFGCFLAAGAAIAASTGARLLDWYLGLVLMHLTPSGYTLLGLTALVAALVAVLVFTLLRFSAAAAATRRARSGGGGDTALLSAALQEAVDQAQSARARDRGARRSVRTPERRNHLEPDRRACWSSDLNGEVRILNPAGRRMLNLPESLSPASITRSPREQPLHRR